MEIISRETEINDLPDEVLYQILSLLNPREAVRACTVSRRWRNYWSSLNSLNFDLTEFRDQSCITERGDDVAKFKKFVSSVLRLRDSFDLKTFKLRWKKGNTLNPIYNTCFEICADSILYALKHNARAIHIDAYSCDSGNLPPSVFNCSSLEELCLRLKGPVLIYNEIQIEILNLPRLKRLNLCGVNMEKDLMNRILSGCSVLESLFLDKCGIEFSQISSKNLKYLVINNCKFLNLGSDLFISTPNLETLHLTGNIRSRLILKNMYSLNEACISFTTDCDDDSTESESNFINLPLGFQILELSGNLVKGLLEMELFELPAFYKVKNLSLGYWCARCNLYLMSHFVKHSPNSEKLTLEHTGYYLFNKTMGANIFSKQDGDHDGEWEDCVSIQNRAPFLDG